MAKVLHETSYRYEVEIYHGRGLGWSHYGYYSFRWMAEFWCAVGAISGDRMRILDHKEE